MQCSDVIDALMYWTCALKLAIHVHHTQSLAKGHHCGLPSMRLRLSRSIGDKIRHLQYGGPKLHRRNSGGNMKHQSRVAQTLGG